MESSNICQCCLAKVCYKNITNEYYWAIETVVYADLLKETFNITVPGEGCKYICDHCVTRLQDASVFRRQIVQAQKDMLQILARNDPEQSLSVKDVTSVESVSSDNSADDDFSWEIDKEHVKSDTDIQNTDTIKCNNNVVDVSQKSKVEAYGLRNRDVRSKYEDNSVTSKPKRFKIKKEIKEDSLKLLKYSNICLFKSLKTKYQCYTCKEPYIKISDLREHSKSHLNPNNGELKVNLSGHSYINADISCLKCEICLEQVNNLNNLTNHLTNKHGIIFLTTEHMFIQYKLEEGFKCVICEENFNTFVPLSTHMNTHSTNNICEICGVFFINRLTLRTHIHSMHREKNCSLCNAKFDKNYAKVKHMKTVHNIGTSKRYCTLCNKTFRHSYKLDEHRIREHGVQRPVSNCSQCRKTFLTPQNLKVHIRSVHIRERNFQCYICGMRFFTKRDEVRHKRRHEDVKSFSCSYCEGKFKSKDSWRRHLRRLHSIDC